MSGWQAAQVPAAPGVIEGQQPAHQWFAFRHARAASLLRGGVTIKEIGDVLGHRSTESTAAYLRLATDDLRTVALNMPVGVAP